MQLIEPAQNMESQFLHFLEDFDKNDPENAEYYREAQHDFKSYVQSLKDEAKGINLPEGYVPCSNFWMVDALKNIIGVIRVRHNIDSPVLALEAGHIGYDTAPAFRRQGYGTRMLELGLKQAKQHGIREVLVTADEVNIGSRKIIENNGGRFEETIFGEVNQTRISRYWFDLTTV